MSEQPNAVETSQSPTPETPFRFPGERIAWWALLLIGLAFGVAVRIFPLGFIAPDGVVLVTDPDSALHLHLVRSGMEQGVLRPAMIAEDNAPFGAPNPWTTAHTLWLRTVGFLTGSGPADLDRITLVAAPLLGLATIVLGAWLLRLAGGWWASLAGAASLLVLPNSYTLSLPGYLDHHTLQNFALVAAFGSVVAARSQLGAKRAALLGVIGGFGHALHFWIGALEHIPFFPLFVLLAAGELLICDDGPEREARRRFWFAWAAASLSLLCVGLLLDGTPPRTLERLHPIHLLLWLSVCVVLARAWRVPTTSGRLASMATTGLGCVAIIAVAYLAFGFGHVRNLLVIWDKDFAGHLFVIEESIRASSTLDWLNRLVGLLGFTWLAMLFPAVAMLRARNSGPDTAPIDRAQFLLHAWCAFVILAMTALIWDQLRWARPATAVIGVLAPILAVRLMPDWRALSVWVAVSVAVPCWLAANSHSKVVEFWGRPGATLAHMPRTAWAIREDLRRAGFGKDAVLLAPYSLSAWLIQVEAGRTIGSAYWSNMEGQRDMMEMYATPNEDALVRLLRRRQVAAIILPDIESLQDEVARAVAFRLQREPEPLLVNLSAFVRFIRRNTALEAVPTPTLKSVGVPWKILRLRLPQEPNRTSITSGS